MTRHVFDGVPNDLRYSFRQLVRRPGFTAIALLTLSLGVGAPTAMFSVVHAVLLRPLPYLEPDRLVRFRMEAESPAGPVSFDALPASMALTWVAESQTLADLALFNDRSLTLTTSSGPFRLTGLTATPNLFSVLATRPEVGRTFGDAGDAREIVLSHRAWRQFFNSDRAVVDSLITMDGDQYRVVGVMPEAFQFPSPETAFWVPQQLSAGGTRGMVLPAVARLKPAGTVAAVRDEGRARLADENRGPFKSTLVVETLQDQLVGGVRRILWVLLGAVAFVSMIATANLALLILTRAAGREREFSIRTALGAGRLRLVRQLIVEGFALGSIGGLTGLALASAITSLLVALAPTAVPRLQHVTLNSAVLAFAAVLTLGSTLLVGLLSARRALHVTSPKVLNPTTPGRRQLNLLAASELALTMVLLVGAGLLLRSFIGLVRTDQGFDPAGAVALQVNLPASRYPTPEARLAFDERLLDAIQQAGGVTAAGLATTLPMRQPTGRFAFGSSSEVLTIEDPALMPVVDVHMVTDGFMEAMGLRLIDGRFVARTDSAGAEPVIVISAQFARQQFSGRRATGELLYSRSGNRRVIGVVEDVRPAELGAAPKPDAYIPLRQSFDVLAWFSSATVVARGGDPQAIVSSLRPIVLTLDSQSPPFNVRPLGDDHAHVVAGPRFSAAILAMFAGVALAMAWLGVYGVMAYSMRLRTREIGVRLAVGATRAQILRLLLGNGLAVVAAGLGMGLLGAMLLTQTLTGLLHEVTPAEAPTMIAVAGLLALSGMAATLVPALRATKRGVLAALREE